VQAIDDVGRVGEELSEAHRSPRHHGVVEHGRLVVVMNRVQDVDALHGADETGESVEETVGGICVVICQGAAELQMLRQQPAKLVALPVRFCAAGQDLVVALQHCRSRGRDVRHEVSPWRAEVRRHYKSSSEQVLDGQVGVTRRSYGQPCAVARALDVVGDRWTLLIVRELLTRGQARFTELQKGLPGLAPNLLAQHVAELTRSS
jgi:hypothetical protein